MSYLPSSPEVTLDAVPAASPISDTFSMPMVDSGGNLVRATLAQVLTWIEGHFADLSSASAPVILTGNTLLDASIHQRRLLVATSSLTLNAPAVLGNLGQTFDATIVADGTAVVTWGSGIIALSGTLSPGQSARVVAYNNGSTTIVRALSNVAGAPVPSVSLANVPTTGWVSGTARTLTGATATLANITTAYAVLWSGTAEVGARQAFTSSATLAALSFTPSAANATSTIRIYDSATAGTQLAQTAAFTVAAAAGGMPVAAYNGSVVSANGLYKLVAQPTGPASANATVPNGATYAGCIIVRTNPTGVDQGNDNGTTYNGENFPPGSDPANGTVDAAHGGFSSVAFGWHPTATGTAQTALYPLSGGSRGSSGSLIGKLPGAYNWYTYNGSPAAASGSTLYLIITTGDGQTMAIGPLTKA